MKAASWLLRVTDAGGKRHRGRVSFMPDPPTTPPSSPDEFQIVLLGAARNVSDVPAATAVCAPRLAKRAAAADESQTDAVATIRKDSALPPALAEQYRAGTVNTPAGGMDAAKVFLRDGRVRLEPLALMLVEQALAEAMAPYVAVVRHELRLSPIADGAAALRERLHPEHVSERPPLRAPAIARLRKVLRALERRRTPAESLEQLTEDLRFLRLFAPGPHGITGGGLDRLLRDVMGESPSAPTDRRASGGRIVELRPRGDRG